MIHRSLELSIDAKTHQLNEKGEMFYDNNEEGIDRSKRLSHDVDGNVTALLMEKGKEYYIKVCYTLWS